MLCGASVSSLEKGIAFSPLWPLWPLWCLCVASVEKRHCILSSMKKKRNCIEECTQCLISTEVTQRHHRGHRGQRGENAIPFFRKVTEAGFVFADGYSNLPRSRKQDPKPGKT